jgi:hypothetical protein
MGSRRPYVLGRLVRDSTAPLQTIRRGRNCELGFSLLSLFPLQPVSFLYFGCVLSDRNCGTECKRAMNQSAAETPCEFYRITRLNRLVDWLVSEVGCRPDDTSVVPRSLLGARLKGEYLVSPAHVFRGYYSTWRPKHDCPHGLVNAQAPCLVLIYGAVILALGTVALRIGLLRSPAGS